MALRSKIIEFIKKQHSDRFRVVDNTGEDKKIIAGQFPDVIFFQQEPPPNSNILFVMKIEEPEHNLLDSVSEWKALGTAQSVFYIVVPKELLDDAKKLADATGVKSKFAWYESDGDNIKQIQYE